LAFNVDDPARARADPGRDARRATKGMAGELRDAKPVDLPDRFALGIDQGDVAQDHLLHAVAKPAETEDLLLDGALDMLRADDGRILAASNEIGLDEEIANMVDDE